MAIIKKASAVIIMLGIIAFCGCSMQKDIGKMILARISFFLLFGDYLYLAR